MQSNLAHCVTVISEAFLDGATVVTPEWSQTRMHGVNNPRDLFLPLGNEIMEAPGSRRSRFFEYLSMRHLFEKWFQEDASDLRTGFEEDRNGRESRRDREGFRYRSGSIY